MSEIITHCVKVYRLDGGTERIPCLSEQEAKEIRRERIAQGGVKLALIGTLEEIIELDKMFARE